MAENTFYINGANRRTNDSHSLCTAWAALYAIMKEHV